MDYILSTIFCQLLMLYRGINWRIEQNGRYLIAQAEQKHKKALPKKGAKPCLLNVHNFCLSRVHSGRQGSFENDVIHFGERGEGICAVLAHL